MRIPPLFLVTLTIRWIGVKCFLLLIRPLPAVRTNSASIATSSSSRSANTRASSSTRSISPSSSAQSSCLYNSWQSHVSTHPMATSGLDKLLGEVTGESHDVAFLFVGQAHMDDFETLVQQASQRFTTLVTILGAGVVGENVELDEPNQPGLSILVGNLPEGASLECFPITTSEETEGAIRDLKEKDGGSYLLLADPWSEGVETLMETLSQTDSVVAGGISCPTSSNQPSLALGDQILPPGSVLGIQFSGTIGLQTLVAQGCRPIGQAFTVTEIINDNIITKLNDQPAVQVLQDLTNSATPEEQERIKSGLLCGIASPDEEDYLSRQIIGFAPAAGGIAVGARIKTGDSFCFQVRDRNTAVQDMELMVRRAKTTRMFEGSAESYSVPLAALQISCVARGRAFFGAPNVDLSRVQELLEGPVAGFYANGEIGPVGLSTATSGNGCFLHGFTTVAAVLCEQRIVLPPPSQANPMVDAWG